MNQRDWLILHELEEIKRKQSWWLDFSSNIAGNAVFDGAAWLVSKLMKKL